MSTKLSNKQIVLNALLPLKGKSFSDREALDDAFLPFFGPLQNFFHGEGHRDLVDRLIRVGWVTYSGASRVNSTSGLYGGGGSYTVVLEEPEKTAQIDVAGTNDPTQGPAPSSSQTELSVQELQVIQEIGSGNQPSGQGTMYLDDLVQRKLIAPKTVFALTPSGQALYDQFKTFKIKI